jgi:EpsI family protein
MIMTMICLSYINYKRCEKNVELQQALFNFPKQIGDWIGEEKYFSQRVYDKLGVDDSILCIYKNDNNHPIELYIGFYRSQREGDIIHSPKNCMPGAGWKFVDTRNALINIENHDRKALKVNNILLQKGNEKQVMFYWFQGRGRYISSEYIQKFYLVLDSIIKGRTDETFVRLLSPVIDGNEEKTIEYLNNFTALLIPLLQKYLPS